MRRLFTLTLLLLLISCTQPADDRPTGSISLIGQTPLEDTSYSKGVSGASGGIVSGRLILAGGANFPKVPASEGGKKQFYDHIYMAEMAEADEDTTLIWTEAGILPYPMAYSVTCSDSDNIYILGGVSVSGGLSGIYKITAKDGCIVCDSVASLPFTVDNACGSIIGKDIYLACGNKDGRPSDNMVRIDMTDWMVYPCPSVPGGPRVQSVCASIGRKLYVWGGYHQAVDSSGNIIGDSCKVHTDGWCFDTDTGIWSQLPEPVAEDGTELTLVGSAMITYDDRYLLAAGGVNRDIFLNAIKGNFPTPEYHQHEVGWYRFNPYVLLFDTEKSEWEILCKSQLAARAGSSLVLKDKSAILIGGETKPGIRSTAISFIKIH